MTSTALTRAGCDRAVLRPAVVGFGGRSPVIRGVASLALHVLDVAHAESEAGRADEAERLQRAGELLVASADAYRAGPGGRGDDALALAVELASELEQVCLVHGLLGCFASCPEDCGCELD